MVNELRNISFLLHCHRRNSWERVSVLIPAMREIANHENFRVAWQAEGRLHRYTACTIKLRSCSCGKDAPERGRLRH
jgi:hypothetical protein